MDEEVWRGCASNVAQMIPGLSVGTGDLEFTGLSGCLEISKDTPTETKAENV
jgi:hypothetical protein